MALEGLTDVLSMSLEELTAFVVENGFPAYRAKQIFSWMYKGASFEEMRNLPADLLSFLRGKTLYPLPKIKDKLVSKIDGTVKFVYELYDGEPIESVVMFYEHGPSICISTEAGCNMGCRFCASTIGGKVRNLLPGEMLGQIIVSAREIGKRISHVVLMGIGEPLDNYDNVLRFLRLLGEKDGLNIGQRRVSLSTCGLVDKIRMLQKEDLQITLSISLHAYDDEHRSGLMPVNKKWNIDALLRACADYFRATGRRISFEYTLISGVNDSTDGAVKLAALLKKYMRDMPLHVNLIPVNPVKESGFEKGSGEEIAAFMHTLEKCGVNATVRRRLGADISASCGQLRRKAKAQSEAH